MNNINDLLDQYFELRLKLAKELDTNYLHISDYRDCYWFINKNDEIIFDENELNEDLIRSDKYCKVWCDLEPVRKDGVVIVRDGERRYEAIIFSSDKECKDQNIIKLYDDWN